MNGYAGKILRIDLSAKKISSIPTKKYAKWGGGHGMGSAIFFDLVKDKTIHGFCDARWPDFVNVQAPNKIGSTGEAEPKFFNAVTGKNISFLDGINIGRKIWNLDQAIWTLQGRHRDMVHFADYIYTKKGTRVDVERTYMPGKEDGKWDYYNYTERSLDKNDDSLQICFTSLADVAAFKRLQHPGSKSLPSGRRSNINRRRVPRERKIYRYILADQRVERMQTGSRGY